MRIIPDSNITLYKNIEIDNDEQLAFSSKAKQTAYFQNKIAINYVPCTVIKKTGALRIEANFSTVAQCNYLSFVNPTLDNKIIYARIIDYEYINNECVEITYAIDYWQTWMFDVDFEDMYIEREHLSESDFQKAETNPYDPSIMEFKTNENLQISKDIEKPYYTYGNTNNVDGIFVKDALCAERNIPNRNGILMVFSDINLANIDGDGTTKPSQILAGLISSLVTTGSSTNNNLCFYKLSTSTYEYLHANYSSAIPYQIHKGQMWSGATPLSGNTIDAPTNYVYVDTTDIDDEMYKYFTQILGWFTDNNCLDLLLGIYPIPTGLMVFSGMQPTTQGQFFVRHTTGKTQNVTNKKLDLFPYTYYRIITPNGDIKELRMEDFKSIQEGGDYAEIGISLDVVEKPNLLIAPRDYKAVGITPLSSSNFNLKEGLIFTQFPTLPYAIDAFRIQMAAVTNNIIGNNTIDYQYDLASKALKAYPSKFFSEPVQFIKDTFNLTSKWEGSDELSDKAIGGINSFLNKSAGIGMGLGAPWAKTMNEGNMLADSSKVLAGEEDNAIYDNYQYTKPAYGANEYHQINGDGITNFNVNSFMDIVILKVTINPVILEQYDKYFTNYGYTSGRCGIPRVINYIKGSTEATDIPHWLTLNNKPTTYIKTKNCKVIYAMLPVAQFIKSMFDSGVRMVKGDLTDDKQ